MATLGEHLLYQVRNVGRVGHAFCSPGEHTHGLLVTAVDQMGMEAVSFPTASAAGQAADVYARARGMGLLVLSEGASTVAAFDAVSCAFHENSPLVVVSLVRNGDGGGQDAHCGHTKLFSSVTCYSARLSDPGRAVERVSQSLDMIRQMSQPVFLELHVDAIGRQVSLDLDNIRPVLRSSNDQSTREAVMATSDYLSKANKVVVIIGADAARIGVEGKLVRLAEEANIPFCTSMLGKSAVSEVHPLCLGVYAGRVSKPSTKAIVESADTILAVGVSDGDGKYGLYSGVFTRQNAVVASMDGVRVKHGHFHGTDLRSFVEGLHAIGIGKKSRVSFPANEPTVWEVVPGRRVTVDRLFRKIGSVLAANSAILADVGEAMFGTMHLPLKNTHRYFCPSSYGSIGMAVPGVVGLCKACPEVSPIVVTGDGGFMASMSSLGTIAQNSLKPLIFVVGNGGHAAEGLYSSRAWNDIPMWNYAAVGEVFGMNAKTVKTEDELDEAVELHLSGKKATILNVVMEKGDRSSTLRHLGGHAGK